MSFSSVVKQWLSKVIIQRSNSTVALPGFQNQIYLSIISSLVKNGELTLQPYLHNQLKLILWERSVGLYQLPDCSLMLGPLLGLKASWKQPGGLHTVSHLSRNEAEARSFISKSILRPLSTCSINSRSITKGTTSLWLYLLHAVAWWFSLRSTCCLSLKATHGEPTGNNS